MAQLVLLLFALRLPLVSLSSSCWSWPFNFYLCCVARDKACWDGGYTYEGCCEDAAPFEEALGDHSCWLPEQGWSYDNCCNSRDPGCFPEDGGPYTLTGCCGAPVPPGPGLPGGSTRVRVSPNTYVMEEHCVEDLAKPELVLFGQAVPTEYKLWVEWEFDKLVHLTTLLFFTLPLFPVEELFAFTGGLQLLVDRGLGWEPRAWAAGQAQLSSPGNEPVYKQLQLEVATDVYRVALQALSWEGASVLLYVIPRGCNVSATPQVSVVYCWPQQGAASDLRSTVRLLAPMLGWSVSVSTAPTAAECFPNLDKDLRALLHQKRLGSLSTVLLSPYLKRFALQFNGMRLVRTMDALRDDREGILGVVGWIAVEKEKGHFLWTLKKIRLQYWKLLYSNYSTGSARWLKAEGSGQRKLCYGGDATSGSRVYRSEVLAELLPGVEPVADAAWLVNLDLEARRLSRRRTFVCAHGIWVEEDYLLHANLTPQLAQRYDIEVANFHPSTGPQVHCLIPHEGLVMNVTSKGLLAPWCYRQTLRSAWHTLATWWRELSPTNFVVPSDGTALSLFRNHMEPIPWDLDIDVMLQSREPLRAFAVAFNSTTVPTAEDFLVFRDVKVSEAQDALRRLGFSWQEGRVNDYTGKGGGVHVAMTFGLNMSALGPIHAPLDVMFQRRDSDTYAMNGELFGIPVRLDFDQVLGVSMKYGSEKLVRTYLAGTDNFGNITSLFCGIPDHNACLPNCHASNQANGSGVIDCEFADRFVELDFWH